MAFLVALPVLAATLFISPSSSTQTVGDIFSARIYVSSEDQAMNAVSGVFVFPNDLVRVVSISTTGVIIPFWIKNPTFSNSYVTFEGIVPNPGFTGSNGKILT
ncbi:MAG: hypothetical protein KAI72_06795, partial [Candidatus Pacebacteria bacterium]|nr:hypothetical protein [Candidatus Paceibacterota bacterium]